MEVLSQKLDWKVQIISTKLKVQNRSCWLVLNVGLKVSWLRHCFTDIKKSQLSKIIL